MTNFFRIDVAASLFAIIAGILHLGAYFGLWWTPVENGMELYWRVGISVVLIVIGVIVVSIISASTNRDAPESDEREAMVQFKAIRNLAFAYSGGLAIIFMEAFDGVSDPMALAHAVIGVFIGAEAIRLASLFWYLRQPG